MVSLVMITCPFPLPFCQSFGLSCVFNVYVRLWACVRVCTCVRAYMRLSVCLCIRVCMCVRVWLCDLQLRGDGGRGERRPD